MPKEKGAVLGMAVTFFVAFTMLGLGSIYFSGMQSVAVQKRTSGIQAFWFAEGGIQRAITLLVPGYQGTTIQDQLRDGFYSTVISPYEYPDHTFSNVRWNIVSDGYMDSVDGSTYSAKKRIRVEYGPDIWKALQSSGPFGDDDIRGTSYVESYAEKVPLDDAYFQTLFGLSKAQAQTDADHTYTDPGNDVTPVDGITWINLNTGNKKLVVGAGWTGSGLLIINGGTLQVEGGATFNGIIWVIGELKTSGGNSNLGGSIFVECGETPIFTSGGAQLNFDRESIDAVFEMLGTSGGSGGWQGKYGILSWEELY